MKNKFSIVFCLVLCGSQLTLAQPFKLPSPPKSTEPPKLSKILSDKLSRLPPQTEISRERREQAYAKLLEGQRYIWRLNPQHKKTKSADSAQLARLSLPLS